jgi:hypothetical protein
MERVVPVRFPEELHKLMEAARQARGLGRPTQSQFVRELIAEALEARREKQK